MVSVPFDRRFDLARTLRPPLVPDRALRHRTGFARIRFPVGRRCPERRLVRRALFTRFFAAAQGCAEKIGRGRRSGKRRAGSPASGPLVRRIRRRRRFGTGICPARPASFPFGPDAKGFQRHLSFPRRRVKHCRVGRRHHADGSGFRGRIDRFGIYRANPHRYQPRH